MSVLDRVHGDFIYSRRVSQLVRHVAAMIPAGPARVLDVGCGDGLISSQVQARRPELALEGIDVMVRPRTHIAVRQFDGIRIPYPDQSFDIVMFIDVLHHTEDPGILLREASRIAKRAVILKDHRREGFLAGPTLRFMDWVGNARHGVVLPYNYRTDTQWQEHFDFSELRIADQTRALHLYPAWADWFFGRGLHLLVRLEHPAQRQESR